MSVVSIRITDDIPAQVTNPVVRKLAFDWSEQFDKAGGILPSSAMFEPANNPDIADNLIVVALEGDDLVYRHFGAKVDPTVKADMTGRRVSEFGGDLAALLDREYRSALAENQQIYTVHHPKEQEEVENWERLIMPVMASDGKPLLVCCCFAQSMAAGLFDAILRTTADPIFVLRPVYPDNATASDAAVDFSIVTVNHAVYEVLGITGEVIDGWLVSKISQGDFGDLLRRLNTVLKTGQPMDFQRIINTRLGERHYKVSLSRSSDKIIAIFHNVTQLVDAQETMAARKSDLEQINATLVKQAGRLTSIAKEREKAVLDSKVAHRALADLVETIPLPVFFACYECGHYEIVNQHYADLYNGEKSKIEEQPFESFMDPDRAAMIRRLHEEVYNSLEGHRVELLELRYDSLGVRTMQANLAVVHDADGSPRGIVGVLMDVTEEAQLKKELQVAATTDPLTGLSNRRQFFHQAGAEVERCRRYGHPLSIVMLDVDHFKRVNDFHGHDAGDEVLKNLAITMSKTVRTYADLPARFGGEEFMVLAPETNLDNAMRLGERLRAAVEAMVTEVDGKRITVTISLGVAEMNLEDEPIKNVISRADQALYAAKAGGRNRVIPAASITHIAAKQVSQKSSN